MSSVFAHTPISVLLGKNPHLFIVCRSEMFLANIFTMFLLEDCPPRTRKKLVFCSVPLVARQQTYCEGVARGGPSTMSRMYSLYDREAHPKEKQRILESLACSRDMGQLKQYLTISLSWSIRCTALKWEWSVLTIVILLVERKMFSNR